MDVESRLLRSFLAVGEDLHFSRAADRLNISQPALSRQIRDLERRIGAELLIRGTRSVALTESGVLLLREAPRVLAHLERVVERTQGAARGSLGHISIGFIGSAIESYVTPVLQAARVSLPELTFTLTERPWIEQMTGLESGHDDLAFVRDMHADQWRTISLLTEPVCLVVNKDHQLASRSTISTSDLPMLADEPFLTDRRPGSGALPSWLAEHCVGWPFWPKVADEMISTHGILALVQANVGISLMPASYVTWGAESLRFIPIENHVTTLQMAWNPAQLSPATDAFLRIARHWAVSATARPDLPR